MDFIRVKRAELVEKLEANREQHRRDFEIALTEWVEQATAALDRAAVEAVEEKKINQNPLAELPKPSSYLKSYDNAIERVKMDTREELEISDHEFSAWVQDDWNWRGGFIANTESYLASAAAR